MESKIVSKINHSCKDFHSLKEKQSPSSNVSKRAGKVL